MKQESRPTIREFTLGVFLHDIGKFMQRAHASLNDMDRAVRDRADQILPARDQRRTHWHALWTDAFFEKLGEEVQPPGVDLRRVRDIAVHHHNPSPNIPLTELAAEADRLSAGMDRKERDEEAESEPDARARDAYIKTPLENPFAGVDLNIGLGKPPHSEIPLEELIPGESLFPCEKVATDDYPERYRRLWNAFFAGFQNACALPTFDLFAESLLSLSERYTFAVPSSTKDQPDISLHDHHRTAAALAAALYRWHERDASLDDGTRIRDRSLKKFRFLAGDLSGIQRTLFRLAAEQIKGLNKILRARSLMMALTAEAAALAARRALDLPPFSLLQNAGGRFLLLVPNLEEIEDTVDRLREQIDPWMRERYFGDLALILALSEPFDGEQLLRENFPALFDSLGRSIEAAKLRAFPRTAGPVHKADYPHGLCNACGLRPAGAAEPENRCAACNQEQELGGALPRIRAVCWRPQHAGRIRFFAGLSLDWRFQAERAFSDWLSAFRFHGAEDADPSLPVRFLAGYLPRLTQADLDKPAYALLGEEAREETEPGDLKTFEHIALDAVESVNGELRGEPLLAIVKADVDRLGSIFSFGVRDATLSRFAALSRMMDFFFTGYLPHLLGSQFRSMYTVYAGGDDMLLVGPWREALEMAAALREKFGRWTGGNPNVTLSAGVELVKSQHPIGPAVSRAEERLELAKKTKDRVGAVIAEPVSWSQFAQALSDAEQLSRWLREDLINAIFLYRVLYFADQRRRAEGTPMDLKAADWPARWGYYLARHASRLGEARQRQAAELKQFANHLLGLDLDLKRSDLQVPPRLAVTIALYRNRTPEKRR